MVRSTVVRNRGSGIFDTYIYGVSQVLYVSKTPETVLCVGAVVVDGPRVLLVRQSHGHSLAGQWTIPWGRLEKGESASAAARREVLEESQIVARVEGLVGVQELPPPWRGWLALVYLCQHVSGTAAPDGRETDAAAYFTEADLLSLAEPIDILSEWLVRRALSGRITVIGRDSTNPYHEGIGFI